MKPASLAFEPKRVQLIQQATGCEEQQATIALYNLEEYDWKQFKRRPAEPDNSGVLLQPTAKMQTAQQQLKAILLKEGLPSELVLCCIREFFLELSRQYGGDYLYVSQPERMQQLLVTLSKE